MRGELPGQSARGRGAANPCGNLWESVRRVMKELQVLYLTVVWDLLIVFDCLKGVRGCCRYPLQRY